jgi:hypothetical protein
MLMLALLLPAAAQAQGKSDKDEKKSEKDAVSRLQIEVTAGDDAQPVENASVYIKWNRERKFAKDEKNEQNWKTNREGVVKAPGIPRGKVLIQVIAQGWKTFGQWYDIDREEQTIKIQLQKPPRWY